MAHLLPLAPSPAAQLGSRSSPVAVSVPCQSAGRTGPSRLGLSVRASTGIVLVEKTEAEKVHRLKTSYLEKVVPLLKEEFSYENVLEVPKIEKLVVNCGIGDAAQNSKGLEAAMKDMAVITGQRPVKTRARQALAVFKLREGQPVGIAVTLRGKMMYSFLDRLINLGLPRTRDFQGLNPNSFDGHGLMGTTALACVTKVFSQRSDMTLLASPRAWMSA